MIAEVSNKLHISVILFYENMRCYLLFWFLVMFPQVIATMNKVKIFS